MKDKILKITYGGVLAAVIMLATAFLSFNFSRGYFNMGDGVIFGTAVILGPFASICAALGSALADLYLGYAIYIPATVIIKGSMGLLAGYVLLKKPNIRWYGLLLTFVACEAIMIVGYFAYEWLIYGFALALGNVIQTNLIQAAAGIVLGMAIVPLVRRVKPLIKI